MNANNYHIIPIMYDIHTTLMSGTKGWGRRVWTPSSLPKIKLFKIYVVKLPKICLGALPPRINVLDPLMSACLVISNTPKLLDIS